MSQESNNTTRIHETAMVDSSAEIGPGVVIGPGAIIEAGVVIGPRSEIGPRAFVGRNTEMGAECRLSQGAVVGSEPQDLKFRNERSFTRIGDRTTIREYATVNRATGEDHATVIGSQCLLMAYAHVGHNCRIDDRAVVAGPAALAGHIEVHEAAIIGGMCAVHQFTRIGRNCILGGMSATRQDLVPFIKASDTPARPYGLNTVGLERHGYSEERIQNINRMYRLIFRSSLSLDKAIERIESEFPDDPDARVMVEFLKTSERGISRPR